MSSFQQQSDNDGWQTVRSGRQADQGRPAFGRRQEGGSERPAFGRRQEGGDQGRPAFGRRQEGSSVAAPAAFGGGNSERAEQRRQQEEARATFRAAEAREAKKVEEVAAARQAEAENFRSEASYPSLGGAAPTTSRSSLNYKQVVKDMIAKEAEAQLAAAAAAEEAAYTNATTVREPTRQAFSRQRILDELEEDYDGPEEDEENDEINADIGSSRRRGDKGIW